MPEDERLREEGEQVREYVRTGSMVARGECETHKEWERYGSSVVAELTRGSDIPGVWGTRA